MVWKGRREVGAAERRRRLESIRDLTREAMPCEAISLQIAAQTTELASNTSRCWAVHCRAALTYETLRP
eukprot:1559080-Rhodomonas_salina.3